MSAQRVFGAEAEMTGPMTEAIDQLHSRVRIDAVALEQRGGLKIPDLVAATLCPTVTGALHQRSSLVLRQGHVRVLSAVHAYRPIRPETLARRTGIPIKTLSRSLTPVLVNLGLLEDRADGLLRGSGGWAPAAKVLTAVELKLSDWRRALHQAFRMQRSVDYSWVVMDAARAAAARRNVDRFRELGVGLATLDATSGRLEVVYRATAIQHRTKWLRHYFAECLIQDLAPLGEFRPEREVTTVDVRAKRRGKSLPELARIS